MRLYLRSTVRSLSAAVVFPEMNAKTIEKLRKWDGCEGRESREAHTMMFTAAVVEVLASTGIPVPGLNATLLNLNPSAGDLFQDPWNGTYAAVPLALNLISSGAV